MNCLKRIKNLQEFIVEKEIDLLILEDPISLFYLTGLQLSYGKLFVAKDRVELFVDGRYIQKASSIKYLQVSLINEKTIVDFIAQNKVVSIAFDSSAMTYGNYEKLKAFLKKVQNKVNFEFDLIPVFKPLESFRLIKDIEEISLMKRAANITWKGFEHICMMLKENMTEKEIALEFEMFVRKNGADKLSFDPIVCFGKNSAMPHHRPTDEKLKKDDIILMDVGVTVEGYNSDMTRVIFFGQPDPTLQKMYSIIQKVQAKALSLCRPGTKIKDLDLAVRQMLKKENYEKEFVHSLGHGVGLEVHEFPKIKYDAEEKELALKAGMVITIEPGIYVEGLGGVRYEDMVLITNEGYENFYFSN